MKDSERLDLIIRRLYEIRKTRRSPYLSDIMKELNIYEDEDDVRLMAKRLVPYASMTRITAGIHIDIDQGGIDYVQEGPNQQKEYSGLNVHFHGSHAQGIIAGHDISHVSQNMNFNSDAEKLISELKEAINQSPELTADKKEVAAEWVAEIEDDMKNSKPVRKIKWESLFSSVANASKIVEVATKLAEMYGYLPSL
jgi:hypothetical protein